jgi:hypothetical protein
MPLPTTAARTARADHVLQYVNAARPDEKLVNWYRREEPHRQAMELLDNNRRDGKVSCSVFEGGLLLDRV